MEISAITAFNPNNISWRNMTAKQILKYEKQGVEVPDIYVQWAHDFLQNVEKYDDDEITYEKAKSSERYDSSIRKFNKSTPRTSSVETKTPLSDMQPTGTSQTTSAETSESKTTASENGEQLTAAQAKRKEMADNGTSLRNQALSFTADSTQKGDSAKAEELLINTLQASSENEIQELESAMRSLIAEAEAKQSELKQEVANINSDHSDNSTFSKIEQLQRELEQYGQNAQAQTAQTQSILGDYSGQIDGGTEIFSTASDFGTETIGVGNDLIAQARHGSFVEQFINLRIGQNAVGAGQTSRNNATSGETAQTAAKASNSQAISQANNLENEIQQKTGVAPMNRKEKGSASEQDPITGKKHESLKDVKTSQNDGTDTTDKLNISLDEIVKRKVRRGDYIKET